MALSAATASSTMAKAVNETVNKDDSIFRILGDASYATGGSVLPAAVVSPHSAFHGVAVNISGNVTRTYQWNNDTQKLMAFTTATGAQVTAATDLSADVILFVGIFA